MSDVLHHIEMRFVHTTCEQNGHTLDLLTDLQSNLRIMVTRSGAELVSLAKNQGGQWHGFLYRDGDVSPVASGWTNHATLMGFFTHRLKADRSSYRGKEICGGTHSFLRHKTFDAPEFVAAEGRLTYRIAPSQILPEEYPGNVAFAISYSLEEGTLKVVFEFQNLDLEKSAHVSFGLHPGFAVDSVEQSQVIMPSGTYVRHMAPGNLLSGEKEEFEHTTGPMPFPKSELLGAYLLELKNVPVATFEVHSGSRRVSLGFDQAPYVTIWSDGNPFICVEPCWGLPDHHDQRPFEQKEGIQEIPAAGKLVAGFTIKPIM